MQQYLQQVSNLTNSELSKSGLKKETKEELEKILESLNSISNNESKITPSELQYYLKKNDYIDINGQDCPLESSEIYGSSLSIWYMDPGDWEDGDEEDREEEVLTYASQKHLKDFLEGAVKATGARAKVEVATDYHIADVQCNIVFY